MPIRISHRTQGGPFPGKGAAPTMAHDKVLPRGQRADFEALNDAAALRPHVTDAGSLVAANDNEPEKQKSEWSAKELRLTKTQADFLIRGESSVHFRVNERTELILSQRKMLKWHRGDEGKYYLGNSAKGDAAVSHYRELQQKRGRK